MLRGLDRGQLPAGRTSVFEGCIESSVHTAALLPDLMAHKCSCEVSWHHHATVTFFIASLIHPPLGRSHPTSLRELFQLLLEVPFQLFQKIAVFNMPPSGVSRVCAIDSTSNHVLLNPATDAVLCVKFTLRYLKE